VTVSNEGIDRSRNAGHSTCEENLLKLFRSP
jgi:hypothetical protein